MPGWGCATHCRARWMRQHVAGRSSAMPTTGAPSQPGGAELTPMHPQCWYGKIWYQFSTYDPMRGWSSKRRNFAREMVGAMKTWKKVSVSEHGNLLTMFPLCQESDGLFEHWIGSQNMLDELAALLTVGTQWFNLFGGTNKSEIGDIVPTTRPFGWISSMTLFRSLKSDELEM